MALKDLPQMPVYSQLNEQVYDLLKTEILGGSLRSGERLSITDLSRRLGISATPVRDALRKLETDGLVSVVPRSGTFVSEFTSHHVQEVFQSRQIIECAAIDRLSTCGPELIQHMREILAQEQSLVDSYLVSDQQRRLALDDEFHHCIVGMLDNSLIACFYQELRWPIQVTRGLFNSSHSRAREKVREHQAILHALDRVDAALAKRLLQQHLHNAESHLLSSMSAAEVKDPQRPVDRSDTKIGALAAAG